MRKKTWTEKLAASREPKVETLAKRFAGIAPGKRLLVATPLTVRDYIAAIPRGEGRSIQQMRDDLAHRHGADATCPTSTGIFVRIAAEAALEELAQGREPHEITPFWRLVPPESPTAHKLSCGPDFIATQRALEGVRG